MFLKDIVKRKLLDIVIEKTLNLKYEEKKKRDFYKQIMRFLFEKS
jgi:hypothetical protein